jgi:hypothetical protein
MPCFTAKASCVLTAGVTIGASATIEVTSVGTATIVAVGTTILGLVAFHHAVGALVDCLLTNNQIEYAHKLQEPNSALEREIQKLRAAAGQ